MRCDAIEDHGTDLDFCDLAIKFADHKQLNQQFHVLHLGLDTAPAVVSGQAPQEQHPPAAMISAHLQVCLKVREIFLVSRCLMFFWQTKSERTKSPQIDRSA
jgi:hypothetical protein